MGLWYTLQLTGVPILRCRVMAVVVRFLLQEFNAEKQALVNQVSELQLEAQAFSAEVVAVVDTIPSIFP